VQVEKLQSESKDMKLTNYPVTRNFGCSCVLTFKKVWRIILCNLNTSLLPSKLFVYKRVKTRLSVFVPSKRKCGYNCIMKPSSSWEYGALWLVQLHQQIRNRLHQQICKYTSYLCLTLIHHTKSVTRHEPDHAPLSCIKILQKGPFKKASSSASKTGCWASSIGYQA